MTEIEDDPHPDLDSLSHDPELAAALGNMVVAWSRAETSLVNVLATISGMHFNMATFAYYRIPTFEARTKVILAMLQAWNVEQGRREAVSDAVEKLAKLASARNHWIHGLWCWNERRHETVIFDFRAPEGSRQRRRPVKAHDVGNHTQAVKLRTQAVEAVVPLSVTLA